MIEKSICRYLKSAKLTHRPAPTLVQPTMQAARKLLEPIPAHRPIWRASWNFKITDQRDLSTQYSAGYNDNLDRLAPTLTSATIGDHIFIRVERQAFTRLPRSGAILFGIIRINTRWPIKQPTSTTHSECSAPFK